MKKKPVEYARIYQGLALIADPIYQYASFTVPVEDFPSETTEKDLIDSPWMQRLRRIGQLQSARWVYPAAEHSQFPAFSGYDAHGRRIWQSTFIPVSVTSAGIPFSKLCRGAASSGRSAS